MLLSQHLRRPTSTTRTTRSLGAETNQRRLSVHNGLVAFSHFIFRRHWFDCGDKIFFSVQPRPVCPEKIKSFLLSVSNKGNYDTSQYWAIKHRKALMVHAHMHTHMHPHNLVRCTVQRMASLCDILKEHLSSEQKMPLRPPTQTQSSGKLFPVNPSIPVAHLTCLCD